MSDSASTAATSTGIYSGRQPHIAPVDLGHDDLLVGRFGLVLGRLARIGREGGPGRSSQQGHQQGVEGGGVLHGAVLPQKKNEMPADSARYSLERVSATKAV